MVILQCSEQKESEVVEAGNLETWGKREEIVGDGWCLSEIVPPFVLMLCPKRVKGREKGRCKGMLDFRLSVVFDMNGKNHRIIES